MRAVKNGNFNMDAACLLILNGGSSSIKFAIYPAGTELHATLSGQIDRIGLGGSRLRWRETADTPAQSRPIEVADADAAVAFLLDWLQRQRHFAAIKAVGHRLVHGMMHSAPEIVSPPLLAELRRAIPFAPEHLPLEIALIDALRQRYPHLPQVACFDTAFHRQMPRVASLLPIPRRYAAAGVRRYGFHGLSYHYLMQELVRLGDPAATHGRVILAHLGNGVSLAAVRDGISIDTSMGFTPASGVVMGSRCGDIDPGLISYLARTEHMSAPQFQHMVNHESGLLGVSETSADMRDLLENEAQDERAADAIALFCYQIKKYIGAYTAALGGLDTLVFAGGIGEHAASVRARICADLACIGIHIEATANSGNASVISTPASPVTVRVLHTNEEVVIATAVLQTLSLLT
jgi:acetate kinase